MNLTNQKRLAADILKVGETRVSIDPQRIDEVAEAITREEIREFIREGVISKLPEKGVSRGRARIRHLKRRKGLRRGRGSREGSKTAKISRKEAWKRRIRAIRKHLKRLREARFIQPTSYRRLYLLAKGGVFEDVEEVDKYIRDHGLARRRFHG